ncbi:hypothetical protein LP420_15980 [Massilia sp. B-10]|nr:hypothetical protein LP420_15980 [Massilia sp. B-10]
MLTVGHPVLKAARRTRPDDPVFHPLPGRSRWLRRQGDFCRQGPLRQWLKTVDELKASLGGECLVLQFDDGDHAMRAARRLTPTEQFKDAMVAGERIVTACSTTEHITAILNFLAERDLAPKASRCRVPRSTMCISA